MANKTNKIISRHGRRLALRSPLCIESYELHTDSESGALTLSVIISNISGEDRGENDAPVKVESAGLVIRCLDASGGLIVSSGREIISKTLKFPEEGLKSGASVGIKTQIDLSPELVADVDVYIGCVRTLDLLVIDFVRGDFYEEPSEPIPLSEGLNDGEIYELCDNIGDFAAYYPEELSPLVWRCTCGRICDTDTCPMCATDRKTLFAYFARFPRPVVKVPTAERKRRRTNMLIALFSAIFLVAILSLVTVIFFLLPESTTPEEPTNTVTEPTVTVPIETLEEKNKRIDALISDDKYQEAYEAATNDPELAPRIAEISDSAVKYYTDNKKFDDARKFADTASSPDETKTEIFTEAYDHYVAIKGYDKALEYANLLTSREKINAVYILKIDALTAERKFSEAIDLAVEAELEDKKEEIISAAVSQFSGVKAYDRALEFALLSNSETLLYDLSLEASYHYLDSDDLENALKFAQYVESDDLMSDIAENISDKHLRTNLGLLFDHLSFKKKQKIYSSPLSVNKQTALIASNGTVYYGAGQVYNPPAGLEAVSVKTSAFHTVILLSDGSVVAFGDNTFGQCNVSLWKNVVAIDVGEFHTVALLENGTVKASGNRAYGQCSLSSIKDVVMISAGDYHTLALLADGKVVAVGMNYSGQCDVGEWENIVMISAGMLHSTAVDKNGKALAVGNKSLGRCDVTNWENVAMISAGSTHTVALLRDGTVVSCGGVAGSGNYGDLASSGNIIYIEAGNASIAAYNARGNITFVGDGLPNTDYIKSEKVTPYCFFRSSGER